MKYRIALSKIHLAVALVPWVTLAYFTFYAFAARLLLGHWPYGSGEGYCPSDLPFAFLRGLNKGGGFMEMATGLSCAVWFSLLIARVGVRVVRQGLWRASVIFLLGLFVVWVVWKNDPAGFVSWWW